MHAISRNNNLRILTLISVLLLGLAAHAAGTVDTPLPHDTVPQTRLINPTLIHTSPHLATEAPGPGDTPLRPMRSKEANWWLNRLKNHDLKLNDTTVRYPRFVGFCVNVYNWADTFFNGTDKHYVIGTGKRWKARVVNDNWVDSYALRLPKGLDMRMLSNVYANIGAYAQYMAVSIGYSYDMSTVFGSDPLEHKKFEFGFNCARFNVELYRQENMGGTYLHKFGNKLKLTQPKVFFPGLQLRTQGIDAVYYFNHRRYSHGAAYNFSKIQRRSQGSVIAGFSHANLDLTLNFGKLPPQYIQYLTIPALRYKFHYNSFALVGGYGFNWVIRPRLLYNITVTPAIGISHCFADSLEGEKYMASLNIAGRTSLTYNLGNWFFSAIGKVNGHWYKSGTYSLFSAIEYFSGNIGIRF